MKRIPYCLICLLLITSFPATLQAQLSSDEKKVIALVREQLPQTLQLLQASVDINSGTLNVDGVKAVGNLMGESFKGIGFQTEWVRLPDSLKRAGHMVASINGSKGKRLLLIGHLDTVFEPWMDANPFRKINETTVTGQGVNDMKGGNVIIFAALQALQKAGLLNDRSVTVYLMGDEEKAGHPAAVSRADFIRRAKASDIALAFETAQGMDIVATGRRGSSSWELKVSGRQGHSSGIFIGENYGAIFEAARILNTFREKLGNERYLSFNPGLIAGGTEMDYRPGESSATVSGKTNIIAPVAVVQGDLRFLTEAQKEKARNTMRAIVAQNNLGGTKATIEFKDGIPGMEPTRGNDSLVQVLNRVSLDLGYGGVKAGDPGSRGAGDISYVAAYVSALDGLGAMGTGAHAPGETMDLASYPKLIERAALLIYRLTR